MFQYRGEIPASKSLMNRALVIQSYEPSIQLLGSSQCMDVVHMQKSLSGLGRSSELDAGEGGTTFRFLVLRLSRMGKSFFLKAHPKLLARPQDELLRIAEQFGFSIKKQKDGFNIEGQGWKEPKNNLTVDRGLSSQFLSAVLLNAWDLDFLLKIKSMGGAKSEGYLQMTIEMLRDFGMSIEDQDSQIIIPPYQKPKVQNYRVESDVSSAFSVAAAGALYGSVELLNFPFKSLQPDIEFLTILKNMGAIVERMGNDLSVKKALQLKAVNVNLENCPDLFPVLSVLCAKASGVSHLYGAPHLVHKESNRIAQVSELFNLIGIQHESRPDGMIIYGGSIETKNQTTYSPAQDHRMAMAAGLLRLGGVPLQILTPEVVDKSFPEYWQVLGL